MSIIKKPIKCQFTIENFRIDTLAFDEEIKAFVVVEYKKDENFSVIDQGYTYLSLVLNNKAECVLAYQEDRKHRSYSFYCQYIAYNKPLSSQFFSRLLPKLDKTLSNSSKTFSTMSE